MQLLKQYILADEIENFKQQILKFPKYSCFGQGIDTSKECSPSGPFSTVDDDEK